ncbi:MAG TPA: sigma factor-like helix-turn-helix DNA-binding protein, partial [Candidatus Methylomirabilis sp.]|nr:sigma factor-like helix-turn-helix DNA-binding protein [Candidatus Methylomirabilis sp.]
GARRYREEMGSADQWLFGITRHKLQDHWRRVRGLVGAIGVPGVEAGLAAGMVSVDVKLAIQEALASLPAEQRRTLDLIYQNGLTFAETARALRVPPGTVKSRVHAALLTLRTVFERSAS